MPPLSHKKLAIILVVGSILLVTPFLLRFSRGVEKSIFSAMATLTDVKETLDEKLILLSDLYLNLEGKQDGQSKVKLEKAEKHYAYSQDVYKLASTFIEASSKRYPKYGTFWSRYRERLAATWKEIDGVYAKIRVTAGGSDGEAPERKTARGTRPAATAQVANASVAIAEELPPSNPAASPRAVAPVSPSPVAFVPKSAPKLVSPSPVVTRTAAPRPKAAPSAKLNQQQVLEMYREGYQCFARGDEDSLARGARLFAQILEAQPSFHLARYWLSKTYVLQKMVGEARDEAERLHQDQPNLQIAKDLLREVENIAAMQARLGKASPPAPAPRPEAPVLAEASAPKLAPTPIQTSTRSNSEGTKGIADEDRPRIGRIDPASLPPVLASPVVTADAGPLARDVDRPIAIMIENSRRARPQSGLQEADVVYEIPVEGGITRFMAVYRNPGRDVGPIGPVRSCRHYFVDNLPLFDAVYTHCGASTQGYVAIKKKGIDDIDEIRVGSGFWRSRKRRAPHNLYTNLDGLKKVITAKSFRRRTRVNGEIFDRLPRIARSFKSEYVTVDVPYHRAYGVSYRYDPLSNRYERQINGADHVDGETNEVLRADNVVIRHAEMETLDAAGRLNVEMVGSGRCTLLVGGRVLQGTWRRDALDRPVRYLDGEGKPIALNPGNVWVQVVPDHSRIAVKRHALAPADSARLARLEASLGNRLLLAKEKARLVSPSRSILTAAPRPMPIMASLDLRPEAAPKIQIPTRPAPSPLRARNASRIETPSSRSEASPAMSARIPAASSATTPLRKEAAPWLADTDVVDFNLDSF